MHFQTRLNLSAALIGLGICSALQSCASFSERNLDAKLAKESPVQSTKSLQNETDSLILHAPGMTQDQRNRLSDIRDTTRAQMGELNQQSLKLRSVLIRDTLSTSDLNQPNSLEMNLVEGRLKDIERQRIELMMRSLKKANLILGREDALREPFMNEMAGEYR